MEVDTSIHISVKVEGSCVTRNGTSSVGLMSAKELSDHKKVSVGFVSKRLNRVLHAGCAIRAADLDEFCVKWLEARGHTLKGGGAQAVHNERKVVNCLETAIDYLEEAREAIRGPLQ